MEDEPIKEEPRGIAEVRKLLPTKHLLLGERRVMKFALEGKLKKVFLAKNCKDTLKRDVLRAQALSGLAVEELNVTNEEVGVACKKPYAVAIIGVLK